MAVRIPTPELNRFLSEATAARQPPIGAPAARAGGHRLKLIYMTQIAERPPRFAIQVNSRARVTRDYAYFLENRLRARYALDGVPADHRLRRARAAHRRAGRIDCRPDAVAPSLPHDNEYLFTSESVTEGHPDKIADQISDGVLDAVLADDPYGRVACETLVNTGLIVVSGRDLHRHLRRHPAKSPARRCARSATTTPATASTATPARSSTRSTNSRPTSPRASTPPTRPATTPPTRTSSTSPARATRG